MPALGYSLDISTIQKGLNYIGLKLSDSELNELQSGNPISITSRGLGEIGSIFILAAAVSTWNSGNIKKTIAFQDLRKVLTDSAPCSGLPIYCWDSSSASKCCLYLNLLNGVLTVRIGCESK